MRPYNIKKSESTNPTGRIDSLDPGTRPATSVKVSEVIYPRGSQESPGFSDAEPEIDYDDLADRVAARLYRRMNVFGSGTSAGGLSVQSGVVAANQVVFGGTNGALNQDSKLSWDNVNKALGLGAGTVTNPSVNFGTLNTGIYSSGAALVNLSGNGAKVATIGQSVVAFGLQSSINASATGVFMGGPTVDAATANSIVLGSATVTNLTNSVVIGYGNTLNSTGVANDNNVLLGFSTSATGVTDSYVSGCFNSVISPTTEFNTVSMVGNNNAIKIVAGGTQGMQFQALCNTVLYNNAGAGFGAPAFISVVGDSLTLPSYSTQSVAIVGTGGGGTVTKTTWNSTDGTVQNTGKWSPPKDDKTAQTNCAIYGGSGAPNNANGNNGDIYFRSDGGALTTIYQRRAGTWTGIV